MPYPAEMRSNPKSAPIIQAGHTASGKFGAEPEAKGSVPGVTELSIRTTGK